MPSTFDVYGYRFTVEGDGAGAVEALQADFGYFLASDQAGQAPCVRIKVSNQRPSYTDLPPLRANVYTPRNISYRQGDTTYIDFHGSGIGRHHRPTGNFQITSLSRDLQYEACYLFLLSQIGEWLDRHQRHRVHALGISVGGQSVLVLLPMGGGKSTLGVELLAHPEVSLLSDDSPLLDHRGRAHAFPTRIGLLPGAEGSIPEAYRRTVNRMNFGPKTFVDYRYFSDRIADAAAPGFVFLGTRTLAAEGRIQPAPRGAAARRFLSDCVIGMGLFQGLEYVLQKPPMALLALLPVAWSRARASRAVLRRSRVAELLLGRDSAANASLLLDFVRRHQGGQALGDHA